MPLTPDPKFVVPPPALFGDHENGEQLYNSAKQWITKSYKTTPVQKQRAHQFLKQSKITFSVEITAEQDKLIFHPEAAAPPLFRLKTNPSHFICQEIHCKFDRYTKNTAGYFCFLQSSLWTFLHMFITNFIFLLLYLFILHSLPIKQLIKIDKHNNSTPKLGVKDLVATHYDCSPKHIKNMQFYKLNKNWPM